ncbi:MAG TPA: hypothetical protein VF191_14675 [Cyclobacteriaceae bacterium]
MRRLIVAAMVLSASVTHAHAYLDPGTGSMIVQAIVGVVAVAGTSVALYWQRVKAGVRALFQKRKSE